MEIYQEHMLSEEDIAIIQLRGNTRAARREHLGRNIPKCPTCETEQVQLIAYIGVPAEWKCRHCQCKFSFEPNTV